MEYDVAWPIVGQNRTHNSPVLWEIETQRETTCDFSCRIRLGVWWVSVTIRQTSHTLIWQVSCHGNTWTIAGVSASLNACFGILFLQFLYLRVFLQITSEFLQQHKVFLHKKRFSRRLNIGKQIEILQFLLVFLQIVLVILQFFDCTSESFANYFRAFATS